jgi:ABC-type branched-subunit amino acid transport system substrate-binding protein
MKARRLAALGAACALFVAAAPAIGAQSGGGSGSKAPEVGITADEIRIAVVADVDNAVVPGFFAGSVAGVKGAAKYLNAHGGLAGRKVVVDFIDSHLNPNDARNAIIEACENDFALVGTSALFLTNVDDMIACPDQGGAATGIPDIPLVVTDVAQQCSPVSFPINPPNIDCATRDDHPQTYRQNTAEIPYFEKQFGDLEGYFIVPNDLKSATDSTLVAVAGIEAAGVKNVGSSQMSLQATRPEFTPAVQAIRESGANYVFARVPFPPLRQEAQAQGVDGVEAWDCELPCYDPSVIEQGGAAIDGQFVKLPFLPFDEGKANAMLANFLKYSGPDIDGYSPQAFAAVLALREAVDAVVAKDGKDGVTRAAVLEALADVNDFDAGGMIAAVDVGDRRISECGIVMQVEGEDFVRKHPKKAGTFACKKDYVQVVQLDLLQ